MKRRMIESPILRLPYFSEVFEVACDPSYVEMEVCLIKKAINGLFPLEVK
jgi:hypothetical protein